MEQKVVILYGGCGPEREVSVMSKENVVSIMKSIGMPNVLELNFDSNTIHFLIKEKPDVVFNAMHGSYGEDGIVPSILDTLGIPYTNSGHESSSMAINKEFTSAIAEEVIGKKRLKRDLLPIDAVLDPSFRAEYDCILKPYNQGSSICTLLLKKGEKVPQDILSSPAIAKPFFRFFIQEERFKGAEVAAPVIDGKCTGIVQILPSKRAQFYDYTSKYFEQTHYIASNNGLLIKPIIIKEIKEIATKIHKLIGATGTSRSDFMVSKDDFHFLETNTHPGITRHSLVPKSLANLGISSKQMIIRLLEGASCDPVSTTYRPPPPPKVST